MFNYLELESITYKNQRWYLTPNGLYYPSITTVLGNTETLEKQKSLQNWQDSIGHDKANKITEDAANRGTSVHILIERFLKKQDVFVPIDGKVILTDIKNCFNALKLKLKNINEVYTQEVTLFSNEYEVAGRCDLVGIYKNEEVIIDYKTSNRIKNKNEIKNYEIQLAFYAAAHNEQFKTNIKNGIILMVAESGFPLEFKINLPEQYPKLKERASQFWQSSINSLI